jgi:hypothetical protein
MRKIRLFAVAAASVATGFGVWSASITNARIATSIGDGIEPLQTMTSARQLSAQHYDDCFHNWPGQQRKPKNWPPSG